MSFGCQCVLAAADHSLHGAPQTVKGKPARGPTKDEFKYLFGLIKQQVEKNKQQLTQQPMYAFDKATFHSLSAAELGLQPHQVLKAPALSPDIQKVVEHQQRTLKYGFRRAFNDDSDLAPGPKAIRALRTIAKKKITKKKVEADVKTLSGTLRDIKRRRGGPAGPGKR